MKLIVGCPVKNRAWILPNWFSALEATGIEHTVVTVLSDSDDDTAQVLTDHGAVILKDDRPGRRDNDIVGHCWGTQDTYAYMSEMRNRLVEWAIANDADYFFSLDSDILLPEGGLEKILTFAEKHIGITSPAVNMARGAQAWNTMRWVDKRNPKVAYRDANEPETGQVDVVMAAVLMDREGLSCRWESHPQGEDVGLSLDAYRKRVGCWWLNQVRCDHVMIKV